MILHISRRPGVRMDEQPRWIQHTENSLGMVTFSLFMVGNVWTFNSETCDPTLQTACLTLILFVYATLALPIFLILLIIFCLPCMVVFLPFFLRYFPGNQDSAYPSPHCVKIPSISSFFISQRGGDSLSPKGSSGLGDEEGRNYTMGGGNFISQRFHQFLPSSSPKPERLGFGN